MELIQTPDAIDEIIRRLSANDPTVFYLDFSSTPTPIAPHFPRLALSLAANSTLTVLHLTSSRIGDDHLIRLAASLALNATLTHLSLSDNGLSDRGVERLAESLASNARLSDLLLDRNRIANAGAHALSLALASNGALRHLSLAENRIADEGARWLAEAIDKENSALRSLSLAQNRISHDGAAHLLRALQRNASLTDMPLEGNPIPASTTAQIASLLRSSNRRAIPTSIHRQKRSNPECISDSTASESTSEWTPDKHGNGARSKQRRSVISFNNERIIHAHLAFLQSVFPASAPLAAWLRGALLHKMDPEQSPIPNETPFFVVDRELPLLLADWMMRFRGRYDAVVLRARVKDARFLDLEARGPLLIARAEVLMEERSAEELFELLRDLLDIVASQSKPLKIEPNDTPSLIDDDVDNNTNNSYFNNNHEKDDDVVVEIDDDKEENSTIIPPESHGLIEKIVQVIVTFQQSICDLESRISQSNVLPFSDASEKILRCLAFSSGIDPIINGNTKSPLNLSSCRTALLSQVDIAQELAHFISALDEKCNAKKAALSRANLRDRSVDRNRLVTSLRRSIGKVFGADVSGADQAARRRFDREAHACAGFWAERVGEAVASADFRDGNAKKVVRCKIEPNDRGAATIW